MKVQAHVKAGQVSLVGIGVAVVGQGVGTGNPSNSGQQGLVNIGTF